jgi:hypothetical protein
MNSQDFMLQPFSKTGLWPGLQITGTVARQVNTLTISYLVSGPLGELTIPLWSDRPNRTIGLWEKTCLEFFIAERDSPRYWEFNLSPSGDWNVYRFEAYRQGLLEEEAFSSLPFKVRNQPDSFLLVLEFDLGVILRAEQLLEMAISAVLKTSQGDEGLWALVHRGPEADFHSRDSFVIKL